MWDRHMLMKNPFFIWESKHILGLCVCQILQIHREDPSIPHCLSLPSSCRGGISQDDTAHYVVRKTTKEWGLKTGDHLSSWLKNAQVNHLDTLLGVRQCCHRVFCRNRAINITWSEYWWKIGVGSRLCV